MASWATPRPVSCPHLFRHFRLLRLSRALRDIAIAMPRPQERHLFDVKTDVLLSRLLFRALLLTRLQMPVALGNCLDPACGVISAGSDSKDSTPQGSDSGQQTMSFAHELSQKPHGHTARPLWGPPSLFDLFIDLFKLLPLSDDFFHDRQGFSSSSSAYSLSNSTSRSLLTSLLAPLMALSSHWAGSQWHPGSHGRLSL